MRLSPGCFRAGLLYRYVLENGFSWYRCILENSFSWYMYVLENGFSWYRYVLERTVSAGTGTRWRERFQLVQVRVGERF